MALLTDGPLELLDPSSLRPFPSRASFEGLVGDRFGDVANVDTELTIAASRASDNPPTDLDGLFISTVGAAADEVDAQLATAPTSPAPALIDAGDSADTLRQGVLRYLPEPDHPIDVPFTDPPPLQGGVEPPHPPLTPLPPGAEPSGPTSALPPAPEPTEPLPGAPPPSAPPRGAEPPPTLTPESTAPSAPPEAPPATGGGGGAGREPGARTRDI